MKYNPNIKILKSRIQNIKNYQNSVCKIINRKFINKYQSKIEIKLKDKLMNILCKNHSKYEN